MAEDAKMFAFMLVKEVRHVPDTGGVNQRVEVRAESDDPTTEWSSLRYHCGPEYAPRAGDVVKVELSAISDDPGSQD